MDISSNAMKIENFKKAAARIRSARSLMALSRKDFCEKHDFSTSTIQAWEKGRNVSSIKMLKRFCEALRGEGVLCTPEWLLNGDGTPAKLMSLSTPFSASNSGSLENLSLEEKIAQSEVDSFCKIQKKNGREAIACKVNDDGMTPEFQRGDWVAGLVADNQKSLIGKTCIVEVSDKQYSVRRLMLDGNRPVLVPKNTEEPLTSLDKIERAAAVIWHRKL